MDKKEYYDNCEKCGRPFNYAPTPKCEYNNCCLNEYHHTMKACIRNQQPDCKAKAVIPSITVDNTEGLINLANCFVHVTSTNTTYYIDDKHRPMIIWAGTVEADFPDGMTQEDFVDMVLDNPLGLRSQHILYKRTNEETGKKMIMDIYYDKTGTPYDYGTHEEIGELI